MLCNQSKQRLMGDSCQSSENQMLLGMQRLKARFRMFQLGIRTILAVGLEAMCVTFWQKNVPTFYLCLGTLC